MPSNEVRYVAVVEIKRVTVTSPVTQGSRAYVNGHGLTPEKREVESFRVPAVRAADLDRLREKIGQYLGLVTDEDFGDEPKVMRGRDSD